MGIMDEFVDFQQEGELLSPDYSLDPREKTQGVADFYFEQLIQSEDALKHTYTHEKMLSMLVEAEKERKKRLKVDRNAPFLGFKSPQYVHGEEFIPNLEGISLEIIANQGGRLVNDAKTIGIFGSKGSGKSWLASILVDDNWIDRYRQLYDIKVLCLEIDPNPQDEWVVHRNPITDTFPMLSGKLTEFFESYSSKEFKMKPRGYSSVVYGGEMDRDNELIDKFFAPTFTDFLDIYQYSNSFGTGLCADALRIPTKNNNDRTCLSILMQQAKKYKLQNFEDMQDLLGNASKVKDIEGVKPKNLLNYIISARIQHVISDADGTSLPDLIDDMLKYDKVILRTQLEQFSTTNSYENIKLIYNMIFIEKVRHEMIKGYSFNENMRKKSMFPKEKFPAGLVIKVDEAEAIFPSQTASYISKFSENLGTKDRKSGITLVPITQYPSFLNTKIVGMSDLKFVSTVDTPETRQSLLDAGIERLEIDQNARKLKQKQPNIWGLKENQWRLYEKRLPRGSFFPIIPRSACYLS